MAMIPGGLTRLLQPLDISANKSFKSKLRSTWEEFMTTLCLDFRENGKHIKKASYATIVNWINFPWESKANHQTMNNFVATHKSSDRVDPLEKSFLPHRNGSAKKFLLISFWSKMKLSHIMEGDYAYSVPTIVDWSRFYRDLTKTCKKRRLIQQQRMLGGIERTEKNEKYFFVEMVTDRIEITLLPIIQRRIRPYTRIIIDGWKAYLKLDEYGYVHDVVIYEDNFVDTFLPYVHVHNIENMWLVLK
ncbi:hypothetical protein RF11_07747 [Thelohanellus kitauei]|uniref:ISXO2-like transposase domain-containing protein n=1 Tax=Thelohanellus kitauei TaxID=669202 RepID=A0A0C2N7P9_THEKT|nr:hypothetical protein RF11_07747 [Thelohanellus kitauei]